MNDVPNIRPFIVMPAIEVHTFRVPLRRRVGNVLRGLLIIFCGF